MNYLFGVNNSDDINNRIKIFELHLGVAKMTDIRLKIFFKFRVFRQHKNEEKSTL